MQPTMKRMRMDTGYGGTISSGAADFDAVPATPPAFNNTALIPPISGSSHPSSFLLPPVFGPRSAHASPASPAAAAAAAAAAQGALPAAATGLAAVSTPRAAGAIAVPLGSSPPTGSSSPRSPTAATISSPRIPPAAAAATSPRARDSRGSPLSPEEKVERILQRFPQSFAQELQIDMSSGSPAALWQWFCTSVLFSARIKSNAAVRACQALFQAGLTTPQAFCQAGKERVKELLAANGYDRYEDKAAGFLVDNAQAVGQLYQGDLNNLRSAAVNNPHQERALLKKLKGTGDGAVDIFFRQVQVLWEELFPFGDKKALKAARLVGLKEHPQALAALCGYDRQKYTRLLAALVRIDMAKCHSEF